MRGGMDRGKEQMRRTRAAAAVAVAASSTCVHACVPLLLEGARARSESKKKTGGRTTG